MFDNTLTPSAPPTPTQYKIVALFVRPRHVTVRIQPDVGERLDFNFRGDEAVSFVTMMNTGNHASVSLGRKILTYLNDNGYLEGTVG